VKRNLEFHSSKVIRFVQTTDEIIPSKIYLQQPQKTGLLFNRVVIGSK